ncbi:MAG TPA: MmgE/PrpD family protein [Ramlibacter sp.]|uniref:MmgE/PrpD family protein n=1 Tax=Ramlibacter sp. TaxID=1917967 RepID=UPI002CF9F521|nr:MmgE/PrpD family protein [Ramlibacter sp.]HVZ45172.1 MmgE/PrpD family protein [Ramlibacter sp.]
MIEKVSQKYTSIEMTQTLSGRLGEFFAGLRSGALPSDTVHAVRRHTLDTLGAALAGAARPEPRAALAAGLVCFGKGGGSPVWGTPHRAPPALAALVNGTAAHALELDDASGCDHSGAVVVPAVFAALGLQHCDADEGDVIAAIVAGYDVGRRVMEASGGYDGHNGAGWHSTGTCGTFAAAAAVARVLRCDAATTANALGIAGSFASGTWAFLADGAMTKRMHPGHAASSGLVAVEMARAGLTGPAEVFEAPWGGFFRTYARDSAQPDLLTADLGREWRIHRSSIKPFASCRGTHAAVEAALKLRGDFPAETIERITVTVTPTVEKMCRNKHVATVVDAQMSLPYAVAIALLHGGAGIDLFDEATRSSAGVRALMERVDVEAAETLPSNVAARVRIASHDGRSARLAVDVPLGSPGNALPQAQLLEKYRSLAAPVLGALRARALEERIMALGSASTAATAATAATATSLAELARNT